MFHTIAFADISFRLGKQSQLRYSRPKKKDRKPRLNAHVGKNGDIVTISWIISTR